MVSAPQQTRFAFFATARTLVPLVTIAHAKANLGGDEDDILQQIIAGDLRWAFDLRSPGASRALVFIFAPCVEARQLQLRGIQNFDSRVPETLDDVIEEILPLIRPSWLTTKLAERWNCSAEHINDLIKADTLTIFPKPYQSNEPRVILRDSAACFLRERETRRYWR